MRIFIPTILAFLLLISCGGGKRDRTDEFSEIVAKGQAQYVSGDYNAALVSFQKMMSEIDLETDSIADEELLITQMLLGNIHLAYNDYSEATGYYRKACELVKRVGPPKRQMRIMTNLGASSLFAGDSLTVLRMKDGIARLEGCDKTEQTYYVRMLDALYEDHFGDRSKSLAKMKALMKYVSDNRMNSRWNLTPLSSISTYYTDLGPTDSAYHYLEAYEDLAKEYSVSNMTIDAKRLLVRLNAKTGNTAEVLRQQEEYDALIDSLMDPNRFLNFKTGTANEALTKGERKIESLTMRVSILQIVILGLIVVFGVVGLMLYYRSRSRYFNHQLFNRNRELVAIEEQNLILHNRLEETKPDGSKNSSSVTEPDGHGLSDAGKTDIESTTMVPTPYEEKGESEGPSNSAILLDRITEFITSSTEYLNPEFSLNALADRLGTNTKYVSVAINETGSNFRNFINEYRIREARRRLLDTEEYGNMTIQGIAESVGFLSTSTFNSAFKKFTGMTPTVYQKLSREAKGL